MKLQFRWTKRDRELQWHPFQVGFQLLVLPSLVDRTSPDRAWPTPNSLRNIEPSALFRLWFPGGRPRSRRRVASADE